MNESEVITENVVQVRIRAVATPISGAFKVVPESRLTEYFDDPFWAPLTEMQTTRCGNAFQIISHHRLSRSGLVEAWWVTITPTF